MQFDSPARRKPSINITSLIDVLFLLLTFFLVTTTFIEHSALKVELPTMQHADRVQQEKRFVLNVGKSGGLVFNGESVDVERLGELLASSASEVNASGGLILRADRGLPYGRVMGILDVIKASGVRRFVIAAAQPPE